jgi:hypothetical protein
MKRVVPDEPAKDRGRVIHLPEPWGPVTPTQAQAISWGWHPGSGRPLQRDERTCGTCFHLTAHRKYLKCDEGTKPMTYGPATDLKKKWPACVAFLAMEDG